MIAFPNAKINLGLNIVSKRPDGYHNLESCFYPVLWQDILEILPSKKTQFTSSGIDIPGNPDSNLCLKAYQFLKKDFDIPPVNIHLHKIIPIGAGLGGGSADATFTLKMLNELFELQISDESLERYASQLGSDCPFFVENKPVYATGTGTDFSSINIDLTGKYIVIVKPEVHVSTAKAYAGITPQVPPINVKEIIEIRNTREWKDLLKNDFEEGIFHSHPEVAAVKQLLYDHGAIYASMSGSGSAVFGIFDFEPNIKKSESVFFGKF